MITARVIEWASMYVDCTFKFIRMDVCVCEWVFNRCDIHITSYIHSHTCYSIGHCRTYLRTLRVFVAQFRFSLAHTVSFPFAGGFSLARLYVRRMLACLLAVVDQFNWFEFYIYEWVCVRVLVPIAALCERAMCFKLIRSVCVCLFAVYSGATHRHVCANRYRVRARACDWVNECERRFVFVCM